MRCGDHCRRQAGRRPRPPARRDRRRPRCWRSSDLQYMDRWWCRRSRVQPSPQRRAQSFSLGRPSPNRGRADGAPYQPFLKLCNMKCGEKRNRESAGYCFSQLNSTVAILGNFDRLPEILAVDNHHFDPVEIEIVKQARVHADLRIVEIRLAGRPVRRFGESAAAAGGAEPMLYGLRSPPIEGNILDRAGELELRRGVVGPQRTALRAEGTGALRDGPRRLRNLECRRPAVATCLDGHERIPLPLPTA
ncbi:hypothetical protein MESS4_560079 [Mesorhizobium sp. STM 4661]|nr:hypothetical protein MESS4_560079 [Mesorhizobium sp. STM 4661]